MKDRDFLNWVADRLVNVHGEPENVDFVLKVRQIAERTGRSMPRHEYSQMVNELRDVPSVQSKRERIVSVLRAFNIKQQEPE